MKNKNNNLVLIGMPGSGKTTLGTELAEKIGYGYIDSDSVIVAREGKRLNEIIKEQGREAFLDIEAKVNSEITASRCVIATGGSVIYRENAVKKLKETGVVVYLKVSCETIASRLGDLDKRGVAINKLDGSKDIQFVAEKRGQYVVTTSVTDGAGNFNIMPLTTNLYSYDYNPPEIKIAGDIPTQTKVGLTVGFPKITAEDAESGDKVTLQLLLIRESLHVTQVAVDDDNKNGCVIQGATYLFTKAGTYTVRIVATDESFNYVAKEYKIVCGE